jgi:hypothetical protein
VILAAGCVQLEAMVAGRHWRHAATVAGGAMVVQAALSLPITVPLVPEASLARYGLDQFRKDYATHRPARRPLAAVAQPLVSIGLQRTAVSTNNTDSRAAQLPVTPQRLMRQRPRCVWST